MGRNLAWRIEEQNGRAVYHIFVPPKKNCAKKRESYVVKQKNTLSVALKPSVTFGTSMLRLGFDLGPRSRLGPSD